MLSRSYQQLVAAIGISDAPKNGLKFVINSWLSGQSVRPATWRSLHKVLRELGLEELSQQIEDCLTGKCAYEYSIKTEVPLLPSGI